MAFAARHNGGRSQVNLTDPLLGGEFPFLNILKTADHWTEFGASPARITTPTLLNSDSYPTSIDLGGPCTQVFWPTQQERPGNWILTWTGRGIIRINGIAVTTVSGSLDNTAGGATGRYVFTPLTNVNNFTLGISGLGSPIVSDLKLYHADDETDVLAGKIFGSKFVSRLIEGNIGVIRFLAWQANNNSNATTWASMKPLTSAIYMGSEFRGSSYVGSTTLSGKTYSCSAPTLDASTGAAFALADKALFHVRFTQDSPVSSKTGTFSSGNDSIAIPSHVLSVNDRVTLDSSGLPTNFTANNILYWVTNVPDSGHVKLSATQGGAAITPGSNTTCGVNPQILINVGGTGAVPIMSAYAQGLSTGGNSYPLGSVAASDATLMYDADLGAYIKYGGDSAQLHTGIVNGVPPQLAFQLCAEVGAHPHFVMPGYGVDPMTDYVTQIATYCRDNMPSWMVPRFEGPNEIFNFTTNCFMPFYALAKSGAHWTTQDNNQWYGKALSTIGQAVSAVYSADRTRYKVLCGVRTGAASSVGGTSECDEKLNSSLYFAQASSPQSGYTKSRAKDWVNGITAANYFTPGDYGLATEASYSSAFAGVHFTGSITGTSLVDVPDASTDIGSLAVGKTIFGRGVPYGTKIVGGSSGAWVIDRSVTVLSQKMTAGADLSGLQAYADSVNASYGDFTLAQNLIFHTRWKAWAQSFGINYMCGYEGGYSPDFTTTSGNGSALDIFRGTSKLSPNLGAYTTLNYINFLSLNDATFTAEFPSTFFAGAAPTSNAWTGLDNVYQSPDPPIWVAIKAWNSVTRAPNLRFRLHT